MDIIFEHKSTKTSPNLSVGLYLIFDDSLPGLQEKFKTLEKNIITLTKQHSDANVLFPIRPLSWTPKIAIKVYTKNADEAYTLGKLWQAEWDKIKLSIPFQISSATKSYVAEAENNLRFSDTDHWDIEAENNLRFSDTDHWDIQQQLVQHDATCQLSYDPKRGYCFVVFDKSEKEAQIITNIFGWWLHKHTENFCSFREKLIDITVISNNQILVEDKLYSIAHPYNTSSTIKIPKQI